MLTELDPKDLPNPNENIIYNNNVQVRREITSVFKDGKFTQRSLPVCNEMKSTPDTTCTTFPPTYPEIPKKT